MPFSPDDALNLAQKFCNRIYELHNDSLVSQAISKIALELHSVIQQAEREATEQAAKVADSCVRDQCSPRYIAEAIRKLNEPSSPSPEDEKLTKALHLSDAWNKHERCSDCGEGHLSNCPKHEAAPKAGKKHDELWIKKTIKSRDKAGHVNWDRATVILDSSAGDMPQPWRNAAIKLLAEHHPDIILYSVLCALRCVSSSITNTSWNHQNMMRVAINELSKLIDEKSDQTLVCYKCHATEVSLINDGPEHLGEVVCTECYSDTPAESTQFFTHNCAKCSEPQFSRPDNELSHYRLAVCNEGPRAYDWKDKPHRLIYDLINKVKEHQDANESMRKRLTSMMKECQALLQSSSEVTITRNSSSVSND